MSTSKQGEGYGLERYQMLLELWQRERALGRQEFLGLIIATAILVLVSLSGAWWPPVFGFVISLVWLILSARSVAHQSHLYQEMEALSTPNADNLLFQSHRFEQVEVRLPFLGRATSWLQPASRYIFLGTPALFAVVWFFGFIISAAT